MKEFLEYILVSLVDHPEEVSVAIDEDDVTITATVHAHAQDVGRIIGKEGKTINAIRALAKVGATKQKKKLVLVVS